MYATHDHTLHSQAVALIHVHKSQPLPKIYGSMLDKITHVIP